MAILYPLQNDDPKPLQPTGEFAHANFPESAHAVDFECPPGTAVVAADDGEIIFVKDDAPSDEAVTPQEYLNAKARGEEKQLFAERTNLIGIRHHDDTYTEYIHLSQGSSSVKLGDKVRKGQVIATTALSGVMDKPHLHFNRFKVVEDDSGKRAESIPFEMVHTAREQVEEVLENLW
jgi:murein DD-endopeptidase MepM/ murein hydrolase activator NlpD